MLLEISIRMFLKLWHCQIIWYLFAGLKTMILCFFTLYDSWNVFPTKLWFLKTSTRIMKYDSRIMKLNPGIYRYIYVLYTWVVMRGPRGWSPARKGFRIYLDGLKCFSHLGLFTNLALENLGSMFGPPYWFNNTEVCLGGTLVKNH